MGNLKTLLVAIAKMENPYLKDWVEYYRKLGFMHIVLCDNNDVNGERFEDVIGNYIKDGYVDVEDYRGVSCPQKGAYKDCYDKYAKDYDWVAFFDIDEYLYFRDTQQTISEYLLEKAFENFDSIKFNWLCYGDNDKLMPDYSVPVYERFTTIVKPVSFTKSYQNIPENCHVKPIIRGNLKNVWFPTPHNPRFDGDENKCCNASGKKLEGNTPFAQMDYRTAFIKHYATKTVYEYINKIKRGDAITELTDADRRDWAKKFFVYNKRTMEKEKVFMNELGFDVSISAEKRKDVQLFMLCYVKEVYSFVDNAVMTPLQCGAANGIDVCPLKDNVGDNISKLNFFWVENTGIYWIWKNIKDAKYKGQTQYRRRLEGINETTDYDKIFSEYDIICAKPYNYPANHNSFIPSDTVEGGYAYSHCIDDILLLEKVIKEKYPEYAEDYDKYIKKGENLYYSNGFVLPAEEYDKYCEFLFDVISQWLNKAGVAIYEDLIVHVARNLGAGKYIRYPMEGFDPMKLNWHAVQYQTRIGGYLSERVFTLYLYHNFPKRYEVDYEKMEAGMYI